MDCAQTLDITGMIHPFQRRHRFGHAYHERRRARQWLEQWGGGRMSAMDFGHAGIVRNRHGAGVAIFYNLKHPGNKSSLP
jgi:hypothetical protein